MKVLVACEYSRIVSEAFELLGHDVTSCDILPAEKPGNHYQGDVFEILYSQKWDLLIGHPPCTYLSYAGVAYWAEVERTIKRIEAAKFFMDLYNSPIKYVAIENPRGIMSQLFRKPDQEIHPYYFGESKMKRTDLWLKNLPPLKYNLQNDLFNTPVTACEKPKPIEITLTKKTGRLKKRYDCDSVKSDCFMNGHLRSRFFPEVAKAMANQWTEHINNL
jgi:site-specific DNA-cytosine methylase